MKSCCMTHYYLVFASVKRLEMEDALKVPVDLVTNDSSDHEFLNLIAKDELLLYGYPGN